MVQLIQHKHVEPHYINTLKIWLNTQQSVLTPPLSQSLTRHKPLQTIYHCLDQSELVFRIQLNIHLASQVTNSEEKKEEKFVNFKEAC